MNDDRMFKLAVDDWLEAGSDRTPRPAVDAVLLAIRTTPQERDLRIPWRNHTMSSPLRLGAAIAVIAVVAVVGANYLRPGTDPGIGATPTTTPSPTVTPAPSPTSAAPTRSPLVTSDWTEYTSSQYGSTLAYPPDWTSDPATRAWTYEADGDDAGLPSTPAADHFTNPTGDVRVSAWSVPIDPSEVPDWDSLQWGSMEAWAVEHCAKLTGAACDGIADRAEPMCLERRDCHQGAVVIPGRNEVIAYVLDYDNARIRVIAVWRHELDPEVASYGGARMLLEGFLQTMNVWPPLPEQMTAS
jgi:hypothetical protein